MKKYMLNLKENEEMMIDVDDQMESIMVGFRKAVKDLNEKDLEIFANWVKVYKLLNYDIIPDLKVEKIYRLNDVVAGIIVNFRGVREFDLLSFNPKEMTVTCLNAKDGKNRNYTVRRLLVPTTVEEALMYVKRDIDELGGKLLVTTFEQIKKYGDKLDVTTTILNKSTVKQQEVKGEVKEMKQQEQEVKETKQQEQEVKGEVKEMKQQEQEVKGEVKEMKQQEVKGEVKTRTEAEIIDDCLKHGKPIDFKELRRAAKIKQQEIRNGQIW